MAERKESKEDFAKRMNNAELEKTKDIKNSFNSSYLRDQNFEINGKRMEKVNRDLNLSFKIGLSISLLLTYFSVVLFIQNFVNILSMRSLGILDYPFFYSGWLVVLPFAITGMVMTVLANRLFKKKCTFILYIVYIVYGIVGFLSFLGLWDEMSFRGIFKYFSGCILCIIAVVGLILSRKTAKALKELDYLVTQEGFPTFNSAMFYMHRSRYVRYREKWESSNRKQSSYSESEKPVENIIVTKAEKSYEMEGISAVDEDKENWFMKNKLMEQKYKEEAADIDYMGQLSSGEMPMFDNADYNDQIGDSRKRPL